MFYHARSTDFKKKIERVYEQARNWYQRWFEEMEHEFPLGIFRPETHRTTFSDVPLLPEIFRSIAPKRDFPETFCKW